MILNAEKHVGRSTILQVTDLNDEDAFMEKRDICVDTLDNILTFNSNLG